jgi:hypothetical protein
LQFVGGHHARAEEVCPAETMPCKPLVCHKSHEAVSLLRGSQLGYRRIKVHPVSWQGSWESSLEVYVTKNPNAMMALLWAGFSCGVLDITAALVVYGFFGLKPMRLLQGIASGLLGSSAFNGGLATAMLGLLCHFGIAFGAAAVYLWASESISFLNQQAALSGILYGVAVYFIMNRIVLPLSAAAKRPFSVQMMVIGVIIHIFCVGLPIALITRRFSR